MSEIDTSGGGKKGGKPKGKKMSTRVDFTPMVDLGFLLITFFMLTTTMSTPQAMEISMPVKDEALKDDKDQKVKASQAVTVLLTDKDKVVYYFIDVITGAPLTPVVTNYSADGIRKMLLKENRDRNRVGVDSIPVYKKMLADRKIDENVFRKNMSRIKAYKDGLIVVIKADDKAKYKNVVDILDEMSICNIGRYAMVDITPVEVEMIGTVQL
jgi:biopolymer transport protein ExbD